MKVKDPSQRYYYYFMDKYTKELQYATVAYSFVQAVKQLEEKHPGSNIKDRVENHAFEYSRKPYVPKEEPQTLKQDKFKQLGFKGFVDNQ